MVDGRRLDGWSRETGRLSAHYENTIAITDDGCEILTMLPEEFAEGEKDARTRVVIQQ